MSISYGVEVQDRGAEGTVFAVVSIENRDFSSDPSVKTYLDYCGTRAEADAIVDYLCASHEAN